MWPVSAGFLAALREPEMKSKVLITASDGSELTVDGGAVHMDARASITRTADLALTANDRMDVGDVYDLLMTPGLEVSIRRGLMVAGVAEYVPLGVFSTDTCSKPRRKSSAVTWNASDRSKKIARARLTDTYSIASGTPLAEAGEAFLVNRWSATPCDFSNVLDVLGSALVFDAGADSDPWKSAQQMFADFGYELAFDGTGTCRAIPVPDPETMDAVFDFGSGETSLITDGETEGTFEFTYNGAIVTGEGPDIDTPVRAEVWDDNPNSPTYYMGGFGRVPYFYSSPLMRTVEMCEVAGRTILSRVKGHRQSVSWSSIVNSALTPFDVVKTTDDGIPARLVLDKLDIPIRASEAMGSIAREVMTR